MPIFNHMNSITIAVTFSFPEIQLILGSYDQKDHNRFKPHPSLYFSINFQFPQNCINMQKLRPFHYFVQEVYLIQNLVGQEHFGPYLRSKIFPKFGICAGI